MARTKNRRRARAMDQIDEIGRLSFQPGNEISQAQQGEDDNDSDDDEDMELEAGGGVLLPFAGDIESHQPELTSSVMPLQPSLNTSDAESMIRMYHQRPLSDLQDLSNLWILPVTTDYGVKYRQRDIPSPIALMYHKSCQLIRRHWNCEAVDCIPGELRKQTPYSLALLYQIRRLASHTKKKFAYAQTLMMEAWHARYQGLSTGELVETNGCSSEHTEQRLQENTHGLMVADVLKARGAALRKKTQDRKAAGPRKAARPKKAKQIAKQKAATAHLPNTPSHIVDEVVKRRRRAKTTVSALYSEDTDNLLTWSSTAGYKIGNVPPNKPNLTGTVPAFTPRDFESAMRDTTGGPVMQDDEEKVIYDPSRRTRMHDKQLIHQMDRFGMASGNKLRKSRVQRLERGGLSRRSYQSAELPSEKTSLSDMPPLHVRAPSTSHADLVRMGQQRLPVGINIEKLRMQDG